MDGGKPPESSKRKNPAASPQRRNVRQRRQQEDEDFVLFPESQINVEFWNDDTSMLNEIPDEFWEHVEEVEPEKEKPNADDEYFPDEFWEQLEEVEPEKEKPNADDEYFKNVTSDLPDSFYREWDAMTQSKRKDAPPKINCQRCQKSYTKRWIKQHRCKPRDEGVRTRVNRSPSPRGQSDTADSDRSAFGERMQTSTWHVRSGRGQEAILCPQAALTAYRERIFAHLMKRMQKWSKPIRFYIVVTTSMERTDSDGSLHTAEPYFHSSTRFLLNENQLSNLYDECAVKINTSFEDYCSQGSGWRVSSIQSIEVSSAVFTPPHGAKYIATPKCIAGKRAVVNVKNSDQRCFEYAVLAALHYHELNVFVPSKSKLGGDHDDPDEEVDEEMGVGDGDSDADDCGFDDYAAKVFTTQ